MGKESTEKEKERGGYASSPLLDEGEVRSPKAHLKQDLERGFRGAGRVSTHGEHPDLDDSMV